MEAGGGSEPPRGEKVHTSGALVFVAATQRTPRGHLALGMSRACAHGTGTNGKMGLGRHPAQSTVKTDSNTLPVFIWTGLGWGTGFGSGTLTGAIGGAFRDEGWAPTLCSPSASLQLAGVSQKGASTLV